MNKISINIALTLAGSMLLVSCGSGNKKPVAAPVPVNALEVHPSRAIYYDQYPGTTIGLMQVDIHPEVEGYITDIFFREGSHVTKGQELYEIDKSKYQASYNQAMANVKVAEGNLDQAQKDADRYIYLNEHDAVAKQILDHAMTTLQNSKDQVQAAKQDLVKAQTDLNYSIIRAPFDGTIGLSQVKVGNTVIVGQTTLNTISTDNPMAVDFVVNEKDVIRFSKYEKQKNDPADSLFTIILPDRELYNHTGEIFAIDRGVNPLTGDIKVRLSFPNPDFILRTGMSCTVRVHNEDTAAQILVPNKAIVEQMGEYFAYVIKDSIITADNADKGKDGAGKNVTVAVQRKLTLGQTIGANVIVKSGLQDGDKLIIDGVQKLHSGSVVNASGKPGGQQ